MMMELILCIRSDPRRIMKTHSVIDVAHLLRDRESFPEKQFDESEKNRPAKDQRIGLSLAKMKIWPMRFRTQAGLNPRHERSLHYVRPFVNLSHSSVKPHLHSLNHDRVWRDLLPLPADAIRAKNADDWPMKSPIFVKNVTTPMAMPCV